MNTSQRDPLDIYPGEAPAPDYDVLRINQRELMLVTWPSDEACKLHREQPDLRVRLFRDQPEYHALMLAVYGAIPLRRMYAPVRQQRLPHQGARERQRRINRASRIHTDSALAA